MSSLKHPVGSQLSTVYWRRRLAVVGVLLLVVVVVVLIATKPGAGSQAGVVSPSATPRPSSAGPAAPPVAPSTAAATSAPSAGTPASAAPSASASAAAGGAAASGSGGTCAASAIALKAITDKTTYTSMQQPQISMSITNKSSKACSIDLGSSQQALTITSGAETYWSSKDCQVNGTHQSVTMTPGQTLTTPAIAWDRTRSSTSTCGQSRNAVPAQGASYHLFVSVGAFKSSSSALIILK